MTEISEQLRVLVAQTHALVNQIGTVVDDLEGHAERDGREEFAALVKEVDDLEANGG